MTGVVIGGFDIRVTSVVIGGVVNLVTGVVMVVSVMASICQG